MNPQKQINEREKNLIDSADETKAIIGAIQSLLMYKAFDYLSKLTVGKDGFLSDTIENLNQATLVGRLMNGFAGKQMTKIVSFVIKKVLGVLLGSQNYYKKTLKAEKKIYSKAQTMILLRLGYDLENETIIDGGWFDGLTKDHGVGSFLAKNLSDAIASKMTPEEFKLKFRKLFLNPGGVGYLDSYFKTFTHDFYMQVDAAAGYIYKEELGLEYAIWSGTLIDTSRPLCEANNNRVFSEKELLAMEKTDFQGKKPGHNIFLDRGGYNCRHILSWISTDLAMQIKKGEF